MEFLESTVEENRKIVRILREYKEKSPSSPSSSPSSSVSSVTLVVEKSGLVLQSENIKKVAEIGSVEVNIPGKKHSFFLRSLIISLLEKEISSLSSAIKISLVFDLFSDRSFAPLVYSLNDILKE